MTAIARLGLVGLVRAPLRTLTRVLTLAAAVALLGSMVLFVGHSLRTMTAGAVRSVPLDWQGPVTSYNRALRVSTGVARQPGVLAATPVATGPFTTIVHNASTGTVRSGAGAILAVPPSYQAHFKTFRFLRGSLRAGEIVFDQQLAATLQVQPGDSVLLTPRPGAKPQRFRVSGVAIVNAPDVLFQPLNPLLGPAPAQPPVNIAILPLATFARTVAPALPAIGTSGPAAATVPGTLTGVQWQVQAQVDPHSLTGSPASALLRADQIRNAVERSLPGQVVFVDNLSDRLNSAAGDALYAETLYIMLAVPGALVALALAYLAALGTVERDRRDLALLRARGATRRSLLLLAAVESAAIGLVAGAIGTAGALIAIHLVGSGGGVGLTRIALTYALCAALAFAGALVARIAAAFAVLRVSISEGRRGRLRPTKPLW
jgi:putative ABC transport system permease protein